MAKDVFYFQDSDIPASIAEIPNGLFASLRTGLKEGNVLAIRYKDTGGDSTQREILPEVLFRQGDTWYLAAFCYLRRDKRTFQINRIEEAELVERKDQSQGVAEDFRKNGISWFEQKPQDSSNLSESIKKGSESWLKSEVFPENDGPKFYRYSSCPEAYVEKSSKILSYDLVRHSESGNLKGMREDIAAGAEINFRTYNAQTAMTNAARNGQLDAVKFLVEQGGDANFTDGYGSTPLMMASRSGNMDLMRYLLEELHSDINHRDQSGRSPLYCAVLDNHPNMVRYYLEHGADVHARDCEKKTTLMLCFGMSFAPADDAVTLAKILIQHGINIDAQDKMGRTALFYAIDKGNDKGMEFLLNCGASINIRDKKGNSPLLHALQHYPCQFVFHSLQSRPHRAPDLARLFAMLKTLLAHGADVNSANNEGVTPLMLANSKHLLYLLKHGANAAATTKDGTSVAMYHPNSLRALRLLEKYGAVITAKNQRGDDVLLLASPNYRLVRLLIERYGFSPNDKNNRNETILHRASESSDVSLVRYLMKHGANQNVKDDQEKTPYEYLLDKSYYDSAFEDEYQIMNYLFKCAMQETENLFNACRDFDLPRIKQAIEYGAIVALRKKRHITAMTLTATHFLRRQDISADVFRDVVRLLHEAGANINDVDANGTCVLSALIIRHEVDLLQEFLRDGADPNIRVHSQGFNSLLEEASIKQEKFMRDHNNQASPQLTRMLEILKAHGAT